MKHTKGPWKAVDNRTVRTVDETHKKGGLIIADVAGYSADNTKANTRLLAAAPDLLEFINHWSGHDLNCDCLDEGSPRTDCTCGYDEMRDKVIAKATG